MIVHVDMDAFYASVEQRDNPDLKGLPLVVGGKSNRGVVSAASYEARKFGIHSAMPIFKARKLCPEVVIIRGRMERYRQVSREIMQLFSEISPLVEPVSIDEAYLDISGCERIHGSPLDIGMQIKARIRNTVDLTCSVGIAPLKFLAKIASDMNKPDGITFIKERQVSELIYNLPVERVPGVGEKTRGQLRKLAIHTLGDAGKFPLEYLVKRLGKFGNRLFELAQGNDPSRVEPLTSAKSISAENTLAQDTMDRVFLRKELLRHSERVGRELRQAEMRIKTVSIKIKHNDFKQITRSVTLKRPVQTSKAIYKAAVSLFEAYNLQKPVRLIGVGTAGFVPTDIPIQLDLFDFQRAKTGNWDSIDQTVDRINKRFGKGSVKKASLDE